MMLSIESFGVTYTTTGQKVLGDVSFAVAKGEVVAILGASGCGKTTLLNVVAGLFRPSEIIIVGDVAKYTDKVATVFQEPRLLPWRTVLRNVTFGLVAQGVETEAADKAGIKILAEVGLAGYEGYYPDQLSIGMQQRVNFARALLVQPELLLMDEPFSALDSDTKKTIIDEFKKVVAKRHLTTVFVTHDANEARAIADRIITISSSFVGDKKNKASDGRSGRHFEYIMELEG